jgi:hypothetical protein
LHCFILDIFYAEIADGFKIPDDMNKRQDNNKK